MEISASTKVGEGVKSLPLYIRTAEGEPSTPPYNVTYTNVDARTIEFNWQKPLQSNGIIKYYEVSMFEKGKTEPLRLVVLPNCVL